MSNQSAATGSAFYPGQDLGLPEFGSGSVAGWSRRLGALLIDWIACSLITIALFYHPQAGHAAVVLSQPRPWTPVVFGVEDFLLTALTGITIGKRLLGLRVVRLDGRPVGIRALPRTLLLLLVVPAMIMDRDLRGLQDKAAGTVVVRLLAPSPCLIGSASASAAGVPWASGPSAASAPWASAAAGAAH